MHTPPPPGWPQIVPSLFYRDPATAIAWLCAAFGFAMKLKVEGEAGEIVYSELVYGTGMVSVGHGAKAGDVAEPGREFKRSQASPLDLGGRVNQALCMFVDDVDSHCERARAHGATIQAEPATHDYGEDYWSDRSYGALDCEGHSWWFMQRVRHAPGAAGA
jgi:uncharacterized glyoxalase superfamily protein PhnB